MCLPCMSVNDLHEKENVKFALKMKGEKRQKIVKNW